MDTEHTEREVINTLNKYGDVRDAAAVLKLSYNQLNYRILRMGLRKVVRWEKRK